MNLRRNAAIALLTLAMGVGCDSWGSNPLAGGEPPPLLRGSITVTVLGGDEYLPFVFVVLTGPARLSASTDTLGSLVFDGLAPGAYIVRATHWGTDCPTVDADVGARQSVTVLIRCVFRPPIGMEIEGFWWYSRLVRSQTGSCPPPLPEFGMGWVTISSDNDSISIKGLDPEVAIRGPYDESTGSYTGTGTTVLADGSSIDTQVAVTFDAFYQGYPGTNFSTDTSSEVMTRRHLDQDGNVTCTEVYGVQGSLDPWAYDAGPSRESR